MLLIPVITWRDSVSQSPFFSCTSGAFCAGFAAVPVFLFSAWPVSALLFVIAIS